MSSHSTATSGVSDLTVPPSNAFSLARAQNRAVRMSVHERDSSSRSRTGGDDTICHRRVNGVGCVEVESFISTRTQFLSRGLLARLPAASDQLSDLLSALLTDLLEVLVSVLLGDSVAADLSDASVEARAVELFDLLPTLLSDLLVEVRPVAGCGRAATLLTDLLVELGTVTLRCGRSASSASLRDGHGALVA